MSFGTTLKKLREEKELTRKELADKLDITYHALAKYETDEREPDFKVANKIADFFGVSIDYLLGRTSKNNSVEVIAAHRTDNSEEGLSQEALDEIEFLKQYVIDKYRHKGDKPDGKR